ncbi:MAG TPA: hypothetical protein VEI01_11745 [Terriglobales bacterium]|nr:hypothetical protein [Terriglobales bacterium]
MVSKIVLTHPPDSRQNGIFSGWTYPFAEVKAEAQADRSGEKPELTTPGAL